MGVNLARKRHRHRLYKEQDGLCYYCREKMLKPKGGKVESKSCSLEHLHKKSAGGAWIASNLVAAHMKCNADRGDLCQWQHKENKGVKVNGFKEYGWCRKNFGEGREVKLSRVRDGGITGQTYESIFKGVSS